MSSSFGIFSIIATAFVAVSFFLFTRSTHTKRGNEFQWGSGRGPVNRMLPYLVLIFLLPLLAVSAADQVVELNFILIPTSILALLSFLHLASER